MVECKIKKIPYDENGKPQEFEKIEGNVYLDKDQTRSLRAAFADGDLTS